MRRRRAAQATASIAVATPIRSQIPRSRRLTVRPLTSSLRPTRSTVTPLASSARSSSSSSVRPARSTSNSLWPTSLRPTSLRATSFRTTTSENDIVSPSPTTNDFATPGDGKRRCERSSRRVIDTATIRCCACPPPLTCPDDRPGGCPPGREFPRKPSEIRPDQREEDGLPDVSSGKSHYHSIDADPDATGGRHGVFQRGQEVLVQLHGLRVAPRGQQ